MDDQPLQPVKKKRGRPKGSKNRKSKRKKIADAINADAEFGSAFGHIPINDKTMVGEEGGNNSDESIHFGMRNDPPGNDYNEEDDMNTTVNDDENENVGFGSADIYDVEELIEISNMNLKEEKEKMDLSYGQNSEELLKDLRVGCVSDSSKRLYESSNVLFLFYIFQCKKYLMHKTWIRTIGSLSYGIKDERKKTRTIKNTIKKLLQKADESCPPINFKEYNAQDLMIYLLSLETKKKN